MHRHTVGATLLALMSGLSAVSAPVPIPKPAEQEAIAALKRLGARIEHAPGSARHARAVDLSNTTIRDSDLKLLQRLPWLQEVYLSQTPITDAGLVHLHGRKSLRWVAIELRPGRITKAGMNLLSATLPNASVIVIAPVWI